MDIIKLGIMQPYFFPYIGYWQLMSLVDKYVIYDDVNYIKGGWINRNRIIINGIPSYINLTLNGASSNKHINQIGIIKTEREVRKLLQMIRLNYSKAPFYEEAFPIVSALISIEYDNLADYLSETIIRIADYLDFKTQFIRSSSMDLTSQLHGQDRVIDICKRLEAGKYINAIGGRELYSKERFKEEGIELSFLKTKHIVYKQTSEEFIENLSIIDVLMNNSKENVKKMLTQYELI